MFDKFQIHLRSAFGAEEGMGAVALEKKLGKSLSRDDAEAVGGRRRISRKDVCDFFPHLFVARV